MTRRHLYLDEPSDKNVCTNVLDIEEGRVINFRVKGNSYREKWALKSKIEYEAARLKIERPDVSRDSLRFFMKGIHDGLDYSKAWQLLPQYNMNKASIIQRAQAMSSCQQLEASKDKDPRNRFKKDVKTLFPEHGCIPVDVLEEAFELLNMKRYDDKLDRWHEKVYGTDDELNHEQDDEEQNYFDYESDYDSE